MSRISPSRSPKNGVPGGKKGRRTTINDARAFRPPYQCNPSDPTTNPRRLSHPPRLASPISSTGSSLSSNPRSAPIPESMRGPQVRPAGTRMAGPSSLPGSHGPALRHLRHSKSPVKLQPSPSQPPHNVTGSAFRETDPLAHRYCRYNGCRERFCDRRTTERHRLTHLGYGTYVCPNPECKSRTKKRPHFASDFSLGRHFRLAKDDSPCGVGKGKKPSEFRENLVEAEAEIQQAMVPFDPEVHYPF